MVMQSKKDLLPTGDTFVESGHSLNSDVLCKWMYFRILTINRLGIRKNP